MKRNTQSKKLLIGQQLVLLLADGKPRDAKQVAEELGLDLDVARARLTTLSRRQLARQPMTYSLTPKGVARAAELADREKIKVEMAERAAARSAARKEARRAAEPMQIRVAAESVPRVSAPAGIWGGLVGVGQ